MRHFASSLRLAACVIVIGATFCRAAEPPPLSTPPSGPAAESRFPPLVLPDGFKATLFACDPFIEYPSVIAAGPRAGMLFVGVDYMTGLGTEIIRRSEVRLLEDTDADGYADRSQVVADGFNSIQGLAWHDGTLYVMHAPLLTALPDSLSKEKKDVGERRHLLTGLGLPPEENDPRLHCANGVLPGHDGWLYLALGDHGCDVLRPEGDRLVLEGGGILRCRPDGRDLHIFATGLRNIYDIALDEDLNVLVRDNENDGGTYKQRVYHSFFGADHGYPYLYDERPDEGLAPLADVGLGSSAGGACYLETQFPAEYRGNLFWCEWGRSIVRYPLQQAGSSFAKPEQIDFAVGADNDPYPFKPTDMVVARDGSMFVSDWGDGQRPKRGRGRIYRITYGSAGFQPAKSLASEPQSEVRSSLKDVWNLARNERTTAIDHLFKLGASEAEPRVRVQAVRALADLLDPVLATHHLNAGPGDAKLAARLAALAVGQDARMQLEVIVALARLRWSGSPSWLKAHLTAPDAALSHAAMQALRRSANWLAVLPLLDLSDDAPLRKIALRALASQFEPVVVDGLIARLQNEPRPERRREYAGLLALVHNKPGPWGYWGYKPAPRPAGTKFWERTLQIAAALDGSLSDPDPTVRLFILRRMQREKLSAGTESLARWLRETPGAEVVAAILESLGDASGDDVRDLMMEVVRGRGHAIENRLRAVAMLVAKPDHLETTQLLQLAEAVEDGPVLAALLRAVRADGTAKPAPILFTKLASTRPEVRAAAVQALANARSEGADAPLLSMLEDQDATVRRAAVTAIGHLRIGAAKDRLLSLAEEPDTAFKSACLVSLRQLREPRAVPIAVAALSDRQTAVSAFALLGDLGGPEQTAAIVELTKRDPSSDVLLAAVRALDVWRRKPQLSAQARSEIDDAIANIHGATGTLLHWHGNVEVLPATEADRVRSQFGLHPSAEENATDWETWIAAGTPPRVRRDAKQSATEDDVWLAYADVRVAQPTEAEFQAGSNGPMEVWLNGKSVFQRNAATSLGADADRFTATLTAGANRLLVRVAAVKSEAEFQLNFRRKSSRAEHERLIQAALTRPGNADRGRKLFLDVEKSLCLKCHRLGEQGEKIGPELTGVGGRFSRIYMAESILEPSRTIAPSFETLSVLLTDGRVLAGVKAGETATSLTIADNQGRKHTLANSEIEQSQPQATSTMPDGFEKRLTVSEFVDLIAFLAAQKDAPR